MRDGLAAMLEEKGDTGERQRLEMKHLPNLIASENKSVRGGALKRLSALAKEGILPDEALLDRLGQHIALLPKTGAKTVLTVLGKLADADAGQRERVLLVALEGLFHSESEVQLAVARLLERHREEVPADLSERVAMLGDGIAPSVRPAFEALGVSFVDLESLDEVRLYPFRVREGRDLLSRFPPGRNDYIGVRHVCGSHGSMAIEYVMLDGDVRDVHGGRVGRVGLAQAD